MRRCKRYEQHRLNIVKELVTFRKHLPNYEARDQATHGVSHKTNFGYFATFEVKDELTNFKESSIANNLNSIKRFEVSTLLGGEKNHIRIIESINENLLDRIHVLIVAPQTVDQHK